MFGLSTEHFVQMCFAVYSQIVLDRVFDDIPLAIRMFLVQKVCGLKCFTAIMNSLI